MVRVLDDGGTVLVTAIGRGWLRVPRSAWGAFVAAVKRGDFQGPGKPPR